MILAQLTCPWCWKKNWYQCEEAPEVNRRNCTWCQKPKVKHG